MSYSWDRPDAPNTAGLGVRLAAFIVDVLIASGIFAAVAFVAIVSGGLAGIFEGELGLRAVLIPIALLYLPILLLYFTIAEGWRQATPGKAIMDLEVQRMDGDPPTLFDSFIRNVFRFLWFLPPIGPFWAGPIFVVADAAMIWRDEIDQRIGDLGGRTVVVRTGQ